MARYYTPQPRNALAEALRLYARAAMDISDGFIGDLTKMLAAADVSAMIEAATIPLSPAAAAAVAADASCFETALTGGDDYEVLAAIRPEAEAAFIKEAAHVGVALTRLAVIGKRAEQALRIRTRDGDDLRFKHGSFSHF